MLLVHSARLAGWPCVILSDQLTVRNYMGSSCWEADSLPFEAGITIVPTLATPQLVSMLLPLFFFLLMPA